MQQSHITKAYRFSEYNYFPVITHSATPAAVSITWLRGVLLCDLYFTWTQATKINDTYKLKGKHLILYYGVWHHPHLTLSAIFPHAQPHLFVWPLSFDVLAALEQSDHPASQTFVWLKFIMIFRKYIYIYRYELWIEKGALN